MVVARISLIVLLAPGCGARTGLSEEDSCTPNGTVAVDDVFNCALSDESGRVLELEYDTEGVWALRLGLALDGDVDGPVDVSLRLRDPETDEGGYTCETATPVADGQRRWSCEEVDCPLACIRRRRLAGIEWRLDVSVRDACGREADHQEVILPMCPTAGPEGCGYFCGDALGR